MAGYRLVKTIYKDKHGRTKEAAKWYVEFRDHLETIRRLPALPDLSRPARTEAARATGTDGQAAKNDLAFCLALSGRPEATLGTLIDSWPSGR